MKETETQYRISSLSRELSPAGPWVWLIFLPTFDLAWLQQEPSQTAVYFSLAALPVIIVIYVVAAQRTTASGLARGGSNDDARRAYEVAFDRRRL